MRATLCVWLDVRCLKYRKCSLARHGTPSVVDISHDNAKCALPEAGPHHMRSTESRDLRSFFCSPKPLKPLPHGPPYPRALALREILTAANLWLSPPAG